MMWRGGSKYGGGVHDTTHDRLLPGIGGSGSEWDSESDDDYMKPRVYDVRFELRFKHVLEGVRLD
jgi:hypothetical protein